MAGKVWGRVDVWKVRTVPVPVRGNLGLSLQADGAHGFYGFCRQRGAPTFGGLSVAGTRMQCVPCNQNCEVRRRRP